jgi:parvulin-like peptidyl-prolyl isomerase
MGAFAAILLSACASAQPTQVPVTPIGGAATVAVQKPTAEPIAALVNGQPITMTTFEAEVNRYIDGVQAIGDPLPANATTYRTTILDTLVDQALIEQAAGIQHVTVTDAELEAEIQQDMSLAGSKDKWLAQLATNHLTEADNRVRLHSALLTNKMRDLVTAGIGNTVEEVHARHILVATEATANEVLTKLKGGTDFAALAAQYSQDTSTKDTGGDLGWFAKGELLESTVEDAAFSLQINQVSGPVKSNLGYHIIQTLERVPNRPISPETHAKLAQKAFELWLQSLEKNAKIEKYPDGHPG